MGRDYNGSSHAAYSAVDFSPYSLVTFSFWGWWNSFSVGSSKSFFEYGNPNWTIGGFLGVYPDFNSTECLVGFGDATGAAVWQDKFPRFSSGVWRHFMCVFNRATPASFVWVSGIAQTLTTQLHNAASYGNFANSDLNFASRAHTSLFAACRIGETAAWGGVAGTTSWANGLAGGASPYQFRPENLIYYVPNLGFDSPEPNYAGAGGNATLVGTSATTHPPVHPGILVP